MASPPADDPLLERLRSATTQEYEIVRELGRGGFAAVFLARDLALERDVAIKVLTPQSRPDDPEVAAEIERFRREARTVARLNHPHVIPVYAVRTTEQLQYFVMKFIRGRALDAVLASKGPLPIPLVQTILQQAGSALAYAHKQGVVHRDIKPANIMLDEDGWTVVADFGIAKVARAEKLTATGLIIGTAAYMSPEQWAGQDVTGLSDEYSLGVVAYELLAGKPPFAADNVTGMLWAHLNEVPAPITDLRADCPEALDLIVRRMLEKDPAARYPSLDAMVAALAALPVIEAPESTRTQLMGLATGLRDSAAARGVGASGATSPSTPVTPSGKVARLEVNPARAELSVGASVRVQSSVLNVTGRPLARRAVAWRTEDPRIATVDADGVVTARGAGSTSVVASCEGIEVTMPLEVKATAVMRAGARSRSRLLGGALVVTLGLAAVVWQQGDRLFPERGGTGKDSSTVSTDMGPVGTEKPVAEPPGGGSTSRADTSTLSKRGAPAVRDSTKLPGGGAPGPVIGAPANGGTGPAAAEQKAGVIATPPAGGTVGSGTVGSGTDASGTPETKKAPPPDTASRSAVAPEPEPAPTNTASEISAGARETCASLSNGEDVLCWGGANPAGGLVRGTYFSQLAVGGGHTCGITADGTAQCWGDNSQGQLGDGTKVAHATPKPVTASARFVDISVGAAHTCALASDGSAWCWGSNKNGQLGDNSITDRPRPVLVRGREAFQSLSAGGTHTCGVRAEKLYCWGDGFSGQLGNAMREGQREPFPVRTDLRFRSVVTGEKHTCALSSSGRAYCWGDNTSSQLGNDTRDDRDLPDSVATDLVFTTLTAGAKHTCGITNARTLACWGENSSGQLGDGSRQRRQVPVIVARGVTWTKVSAGAAHTCGIQRTSAVACWGLNSAGQLGTGGAGAIVTAPTIIKVSRPSP
ncbi:MAG: protein kinase [Gemmatimonadetes bacterium]|nr:protein kinase [Gemmatimonadota bacterium]